MTDFIYPFIGMVAGVVIAFLILAWLAHQEKRGKWPFIQRPRKNGGVE